MKKLLFLLLPLFTKAQGPDINLFGGVASSCNVGGAGSATFPSFAFSAGTVYLCVVWTDSSANHPTGVSGTGQTWVSVASAGNSSRAIDVYRTACTSSHTDNFTISFTGFNMGTRIRVYQISRTPTTNNGADAIRQFVIDSGSAADPTITLAALTAPVPGVIGIFSRQQDNFGGSPETGWVEDYDAGCTAGGYVNGYYMTHKNNACSDNTVSVTASGSIVWLGVAIEINGMRRIYNAH